MSVNHLTRANPQTKDVGLKRRENIPRIAPWNPLNKVNSEYPVGDFEFRNALQSSQCLFDLQKK